MPEPRALALVTEASRMLAEARSLDDIRQVHNLAQRAHDYAKAARLGLDAQNSAAAIRLDAEAMAGGLLMQMEKDGERRSRQTANPSGLPQPDGTLEGLPTLRELDVTEDESRTWQAVARIPEEERTAYVAEARQAEGEVTRAGLLRFASAGRLAPVMSSGSDEWMTPPEIIANVVGAFGAIDLDPCAEPARGVPAARHLTKREDGLAHVWDGRVFANPPYSLVDDFAAKVGIEWEHGHLTEAIVLVPARTETRWWRAIPALAVCFFHGRLKFSGADQGATFPSAALYVGPDPSRFEAAFADVGLLYRRVEA